MPPSNRAAKGRVVDYENVLVDEGIADKRLLVIEPELASVLRSMGREGNTLSAQFRQAWDSGDIRVLTKNNPVQATGAHVSLIGHITKTELLRYLDSTEAANGFGNRLLWAAVRRSKLLPNGGEVPIGAVERLARDLRARIEDARTIGRFERIKRNAGADEVWTAAYPRLSEARHGMCGYVTARAEAQVLRISMIYAILDGSAEIQEPHLLAAIALWDYCEASAELIFGDALGDPVSDRIIEALREAEEGLDRTALRDLFKRHVTQERMTQALRLLEAAGLVELRKVSTEGRPREVWFARKATEAPNGVTNAA